MLFALTEIVDGISWSYRVTDGVVTIGNLSINRPNGGIVAGDAIPDTVEGEVTIPSMLGGMPVVYIGDGAFYKRPKITSIVVPEGISAIGLAAFYQCSGLANISLPESLTVIGSSVLYGCSGLRTLRIPERLTNIERGTFRNCTGLTSITIPKSVVKIGESAFEGCTSLKTVVLNEGLVSMGERVFKGCDQLSSIELPESFTTVEGNYSPFYGTTLSKLYMKGKPVSSKFFRDWNSSIVINQFYYSSKYAKEWEEFLLTMSGAPKEWIRMESQIGVISTVSGGGSVSLRKKMVAWDEEITVLAEAKDGFAFLGWGSDTEGIEGKNPSLTFKMPRANITLVASFFPKALLNEWVDERVEAKIDGESLLTKEQAEKQTEATIDAKKEIGELFDKKGVETKVTETIDQKVKDKELIPAESLQLMAMKEPIIEVKDGKADVGIALYATSALNEAWSSVLLEEGATSVKEGKLRVAVPADTKAMFYRFVVPEKQ